MAKEQFNSLDKTNGMIKLFDKNRNTINAITTKDAYNYKDILKKSKDEVFKAFTKETTVKPDIKARQEAQDEADRLNQSTKPSLVSKRASRTSSVTGVAPMPSPWSSNRPTDKTRASTTTHSTNWRKHTSRVHTARKLCTS